MASYIPYWGDDPYAWDTLKIDKYKVPGIVKITFKRASRLDVRKPPKAHNAVLVDNGYAPAEGVIEVTLGFESGNGKAFGTAKEQWIAWLDLEAALFGKKRAKRDAFKVTHPKFARAGIKSVYLEDPGDIEGEGPGVRTIKIEWREYAKVVVLPVTGTVGSPAIKPKGSIDISQLKNVKKPSANEVKAP